MCILYKKATKEFVHFDTKTKRSDLITDIRLASELTNAEAKELLKKCTKKLKGFQITQDNTDRVFSDKRTGSTGYCDSSAASRNNDSDRRVSAAGAGNADGHTATGSSAVSTASSNTAGSSAANTTSASNDSADYKNTQAMLHKQRTKRNLYKG